MKIYNIYLNLLFLAFISSLFLSCNEISTSSNLDTSLKSVDDLVFITNTEKTSLIVNKSDVTYFELMFSGIGSNTVFQNGTGEGWCIDWQTQINSNGGMYENVKLYSSFNVEKWKPLNFLLNIKDDLQANDPEIGFREIQLAIWSLRGLPKFNLEELSLYALPSRMKLNGRPAFNKEKVAQILLKVENGYRDFEYAPGVKFAIIVETPSDVQTVITVAQ